MQIDVLYEKGGKSNYEIEFKVFTPYKNIDTLDLFMSFGTIFWDVILGWKYVMIFNWEKKPVLDQ